MTLSWHPPHTHAISDSLWTVYSFREWGNWSNGQSTWIFYSSTFSYAGWRGNLQVAGVLERPAFLFYQLLFVRNRVALRSQRVRELWKAPSIPLSHSRKVYFTERGAEDLGTGHTEILWIWFEPHPLPLFLYGGVCWFTVAECKAGRVASFSTSSMCMISLLILVLPMLMKVCVTDSNIVAPSALTFLSIAEGSLDADTSIPKGIVSLGDW